MGATSLAFEVLWTRILVFYLGSSVYAFSLMLLGFLLGVAAGSLAIGRIVGFLERPARVLAAIELGIAACAPLSIWLFATLNDRQIALSEFLHPQGFGVAVVAQLLAVLPVLLPPTLLMGVSFPLLVRVYSARSGASASGPKSAGIGRDLGELYGANTLGCIVGSLAAGFGLVPLLGTQNSLLAVGSICAGTAFAVRAARELAPRTARATPAPCRSPERRRRSPAWLCGLAAGDAGVLFRPGLPLAGRSRDSRRGYFRPGSTGRPGAFPRRRERRRGDSPDDRRRAAPISLWSSTASTSPGRAPISTPCRSCRAICRCSLGRSRGARVVHIGFGSGGTAYAVSRHPVSEIRIVELSPAVLAASDRLLRRDQPRCPVRSPRSGRDQRRA